MAQQPQPQLQSTALSHVRRGAGLLLVIVHDVVGRELAVMNDGFDDDVGVWARHNH